MAEDQRNPENDEPIEPTPEENGTEKPEDIEEVTDSTEASSEEVAEAIEPDYDIEEEDLGERIPILMTEEDDIETATYDLEEEEEAAEELEAETEFEESVKEVFERSAEVSEEEPIEAVDEAITNVMEQAEEVVEGGVEVPDMEHQYSDTFTIPITGQTMTLPGGIYTFVFGLLAALTLFEVAVAEILPDGNPLTVTILVAASLAKALLVVTFYMHLGTDNALFRFVLLVPLLIVLISVLYLLGVPVGEGLGYY